MTQMRTLMLRCRCVASCGILGVDDWGDAANHPDDPPWAWSFEFYNRTGGGGTRIGYRIKLAWRVLRGQDHHLDCVCLDGDDVEKLRDFLTEGLSRG